MEKKESINVPKKTELDNKPTRRITRSQNVVSTGDLSQPSVTENEPQRMRTRSQSSEKSENSLQASKNLDNSHDATLDVTVSLLNMNMDGQKKYIVSPMGIKDNKKTENGTTPKIPPRKRRDSNDDSNDDVSQKKNRKKKHSEDKKIETYTGNDTYKDNMDDVQPVNSDNDAKGLTSENSAATPKPTLNRRRTRSARSNDGDPSKTKYSQNKQREEASMKGNEDDDAKGLTSENSAATPTPTPTLKRMRTRSSKSNDGDPSRKTSS